jgi:hypothetical protein
MIWTGWHFGAAGDLSHAGGAANLVTVIKMPLRRPPATLEGLDATRAGGSPP